MAMWIKRPGHGIATTSTRAVHGDAGVPSMTFGRSGRPQHPNWLVRGTPPLRPGPVALAIAVGGAAGGAPLSVTAASYDPTPPNVDAAVLMAPTHGPVVATGTLLSGSGAVTDGTIAALSWPTPAYLRAHPR